MGSRRKSTFEERNKKETRQPPYKKTGRKTGALKQNGQHKETSSWVEDFRGTSPGKENSLEKEWLLKGGRTGREKKWGPG